MKKPQIKNSFYKLYKEIIDKILKFSGCFTGLLLTGLLFIWIGKILHLKWQEALLVLCILLASVIILYYFISASRDFIVFILNQRRIPLSVEELKEFQFTNPAEYAQYLQGFLRGFNPREDLYLRIIITASLYFTTNTFSNLEALKNIFEFSMDNITDINSEIKIINQVKYESLKDRLFTDTWLDPKRMKLYTRLFNFFNYKDRKAIKKSFKKQYK